MNLGPVYNGSLADRIKREYLLDKLFSLKSQVMASCVKGEYEYVFHNGLFTTKNSDAEAQIEARNKELEIEISQVLKELAAFADKQ